jgi:hypothetical protein
MNTHFLSCVWMWMGCWEYQQHHWGPLAESFESCVVGPFFFGCLGFLLNDLEG